MTEISLTEKSLETLSGTMEENFRYLSERLGVRLSARGETVTLDGPAESVEMARKLLEELGRLVARGYAVGKEEFRTALRVLE